MSLDLCGDEKITQWLEKNGYHPRSDKHGKALCHYFLDDLLNLAPMLCEAAKTGQIVYSQDYKVGQGGELEWKVDLVLGPPITRPIVVPPSNRIVVGEPREIWLAVDAKSVMTEHGKARRNRQRDLASFANIMKHHYPDSVVGAIVMVNLADEFKSPLRREITQHRNIHKLVGQTVQLFREVPHTPKEGDAGIEGIGVIVLAHTNIPGDRTRLVKNPPAPQIGDPTYYKEFVRSMKEAVLYRHLRL